MSQNPTILVNTYLSTDLALNKSSYVGVRPGGCSPGILRFQIAREIDGIELVVNKLADIPW